MIKPAKGPRAPCTIHNPKSTVGMFNDQGFGILGAFREEPTVELYDYDKANKHVSFLALMVATSAPGAGADVLPDHLGRDGDFARAVPDQVLVAVAVRRVRWQARVVAVVAPLCRWSAAAAVAMAAAALA